jgi:hypothetical protein
MGEENIKRDERKAYWPEVFQVFHHTAGNIERENTVAPKT